MLFLNATNRTEITMRNEILVIPFGDILIYKDFAQALLLKELRDSREPLTAFQRELLEVIDNNDDAFILQYLVNRPNHDTVYVTNPLNNMQFIYDKSPVTIIYTELARWTSQSTMEKIIVLTSNEYEDNVVKYMQESIYNGHKIQPLRMTIYDFLHQAPHQGINWTGIILKNIHMMYDIITKNNFDLKLKTLLCARLGGNVTFNENVMQFICPYDIVNISIAQGFEFGYIPLFNFDENAFVNG